MDPFLHFSLPATPLAYTLVGIFIWLLIRAVSGQDDWGQTAGGGGGGPRRQNQRQQEMDELRTRALNAEALLAGCRTANTALIEEVKELRAELGD